MEMKISRLKHRPGITADAKLNEGFLQFEKLLGELRKREIPSGIISTINTEIEELNTLPDEEKELLKQTKNKQSNIIKMVENELKIVPKNYYRSTWLLLGMATFGLPLGVAFGLVLGNIALLAIGLPIGMAIGMAVGSGMDKKALEEGRQLDVEV